MLGGRRGGGVTLLSKHGIHTNDKHEERDSYTLESEGLAIIGNPGFSARSPDWLILGNHKPSP